MTPPNIQSLFETKGSDHEPMDPTGMRAFLGCTMASKERGDELITPTKMLEEDPTLPFAYAVLVKRLAWADPNLPISKWVVLMLGSLCESPGDSVMWAYSLYKATKANGPVSMEQMGMKYFQMGFPTKEARHRIWDSQKGGAGSNIDNWIDQREAWG